MAMRTTISLVLVSLFTCATALAQPPHAPPPTPPKASAPPAPAVKPAPPAPKPEPASTATPQLRSIVLARTELRQDLSAQRKLSRAVGAGVWRERETAEEKSQAAAHDLGMKYAAGAKVLTGERGQLAAQLRSTIDQREAQKGYLVKDEAAATAASAKYTAVLSAASKRLGGDYNAHVTAQNLPEVRSAEREMKQANADKAQRISIIEHLDHEVPALATKLGFLVGRPKE